MGTGETQDILYGRIFHIKEEMSIKNTPQNIRKSILTPSKSLLKK